MRVIATIIYVVGWAPLLHGDIFTRYYAHRAYDHGDLQDAAARLGSLVASRADDWRALYDLGSIAMQQKNYQDAVAHFEHVMRLQPDNQRARERLEIARTKLTEEQQKPPSERSSGDKTDVNDQQNKQESAGQGDKSPGDRNQDAARHEQGSGDHRDSAAHDREQSQKPLDGTRNQEDAQSGDAQHKQQCADEQSQQPDDVKKSQAPQSSGEQQAGSNASSQPDTQKSVGAQEAAAKQAAAAQEAAAKEDAGEFDNKPLEAYWMKRVDAADREAQRQLIARTQGRGKERAHGW